MPAITNTSVKNQAARICKVLKPRGDSWSAEHSATCLVRAIMEELGMKKELDSTEPLDIQLRTELVKMAKPFCTAAKNYQNTYLAMTPSGEPDGSFMMPDTGKDKVVASAEFA